MLAIYLTNKSLSVSDMTNFGYQRVECCWEGAWVASIYLWIINFAKKRSKTGN